MGILSVIAGAISPVTGLIDKLHTSDAERLDIQNALVTLQQQFAEKVLEYESKILQTQAGIVKAEAQGEFWMQRNWRPITMLTFLVLVVCDCFGVLKFRLAEQAWTLLQIGLGGYVVGRSAEKVIPQVVDVMRKAK